MIQYRRSYSYQPVSQNDPQDTEGDQTNIGEQHKGEQPAEGRGRTGSLLRSFSEPSFDKETSEYSSLIGAADNQAEHQSSHMDSTTDRLATDHVNSAINMDMEIASLGHGDRGVNNSRSRIERQRRSDRKRNVARWFLFLSFASWVVYFGFGLSRMTLTETDHGYSGIEDISNKQEKSHAQGKFQEEKRSIVKRSEEMGQFGTRQSQDSNRPTCYLDMEYSKDFLEKVYTNNDSRCQLANLLTYSGQEMCTTKDNEEKYIGPLCFCFNVFQSCEKGVYTVGNYHAPDCKRNETEVCHHNGNLPSRIPTWNEVNCTCNQDYTGRYCHLPKRLVCSPFTVTSDINLMNCSKMRRSEDFRDGCQHMVNGVLLSCRIWNGKGNSQLPELACSDIRPASSTAVPMTTSADVVTTQTADPECVSQTVELQQAAQVLKEKLNKKELSDTTYMYLKFCLGVLCQLYVLLVNLAQQCLCDCCPRCSFLQEAVFQFIFCLVYNLSYIGSVGFPFMVFGIYLPFTDWRDYPIILCAIFTPLVLSFIYTKPGQRETVQRKTDPDGTTQEMSSLV